MISRARGNRERTALVDGRGDFRYDDLVRASARAAATLLGGRFDLAEERVALLVSPSSAFVAALWGIWRAGGIAVPLSVSHPPAEWEYVLRDAEVEAVIVGPEFREKVATAAAAANIRVIPVEALFGAPVPRTLPSFATSRRALMIYTSGTTGRPKGVVSTHTNLGAQLTSLEEAWKWTQHDRVLLVLPLHHVHGLVNVLLSALWAGAVCEMHPRFDAEAVWGRFEAGGVTLFMAVPTIYRRLITAWNANPGRQAAQSDAVSRLRLMVSGSAALPVEALERWREISGHTLLERYGMTEIGMALSNPLEGERRPGSVGAPLPGVRVRLVDEQGAEVVEGMPGEIEVAGPTVFREYWRRPDATRAAFRDEWFRTGDVAVLEQGMYRILGRSSVDILKTGGFKVSALEIEEVLRTHPAIAEVAVVGVPDPDWGDRVSVAVELRPGMELSLEALHAWGRERMAPYKLPRALKVMDSLPRNEMGKVVKPEVVREFK